MPITDAGIVSPVSEDDVNEAADKLLPSDIEGDQRERALSDILVSAKKYEAYVATRDPAEQAELRSRPVITFAIEDESPAKSDRDESPAKATAPRRRRGR